MNETTAPTTLQYGGLGEFLPNKDVLKGILDSYHQQQWFKDVSWDDLCANADLMDDFIDNVLRNL